VGESRIIAGERVEIQPMYAHQLDHREHAIRLPDTKSGKAQVRGFHPTADDALLRWIDTRKSLRLGRSAPFFCTLDGGRLQTQYVRLMLHRLSAKAGVPHRVNPHAFRHTFAVELVRSGADVVTISKLLGHSSIAVTSRYLDHLTNSTAIERLQSVDLPRLAA
jgi:integrase/recombinase XerC